MMKFVFCLPIVFALSIPPLVAAPLETAKVTAAFNKVVIAKPQEAPSPARVGDVLTGRSTLETGSSSRAELTFNDQTLTRIGSNSIFSFARGTRNLELNQGVIFMQVPKNAGGATIQTAAVTAAITGTTIAIEYSPATAASSGAVKIFVLEGTLRAFLKSRPGESLLLEAGQMIQMRPNDSTLPDPKVFDIEHLVTTSGLLGKQFDPLPSMPIVLKNIEIQDAEKANGRLLVANYTLHAQIPGGVANFEQENPSLTMNDLARSPQAIAPAQTSNNKNSKRPSSPTVSRPQKPGPP